MKLITAFHNNLPNNKKTQRIDGILRAFVGTLIEDNHLSEYEPMSKTSYSERMQNTHARHRYMLRPCAMAISPSGLTTPINACGLPLQRLSSAGRI